jgi:hypothetical protein
MRVLGVPGEPGVMLVNVSLVTGRPSVVVESVLLCLAFFPGPWEHTLDTAQPWQRRFVPRSAATATVAPWALYDVAAAVPGFHRLVPVYHRPMHVLWVGDRVGYDGMKQALATHFRFLPRESILPSFVDFTCSPDDAIRNFSTFLTSLHVPQYDMCITVPRDMAGTPEQLRESILSTLSSYDTFDDLPPRLQERFHEMAAFYRRFDAVILVRDASCLVLVMVSVRVSMAATEWCRA